MRWMHKGVKEGGKKSPWPLNYYFFCKLNDIYSLKEKHWTLQTFKTTINFYHGLVLESFIFLQWVTKIYIYKLLSRETRLKGTTILFEWFFPRTHWIILIINLCKTYPSFGTPPTKYCSKYIAKVQLNLFKNRFLSGVLMACNTK